MLVSELNISQVECLASIFRTTLNRRNEKEVPVGFGLVVFLVVLGVFLGFVLVFFFSITVILFSLPTCPPNPLLSEHCWCPEPLLHTLHGIMQVFWIVIACYRSDFSHRTCDNVLWSAVLWSPVCKGHGVQWTLQYKVFVTCLCGNENSCA